MLSKSLILHNGLANGGENMKNKILLLTPILLMSLLYENVIEARADTVESIVATQMVNSVTTETPATETPPTGTTPTETPATETPPTGTTPTETPATETPLTDTTTIDTLAIELLPINDVSTFRYESRNVWVSDDDNVYIQNTGNYPVVTYKVILEADTTYTVKSLGSGNDRFRIAVMNSAVSLPNAGDMVLVDRVINLDNTLTEYTFRNLNGVELYVYLSNYANPLADISVSIIPTEPEILSTVRLEGTNVYVPGDGNVYIQNTGDYAVVTYRAVIEPDTTYTVKSLGSGNDRFRIAVMNSAVSLPNAGDAVLVDRIINLDNFLTEYTFYNLEGAWIYVYVSSYDNLASDVEIMRIATQVSYSLEISAVTYTETDSWNIYPTLFGVKTSNAIEGQQPQTVGWLYYSGNQILYAEGSPTNMVKIADWDSSLAYEGYDGPENYSPYMTPNGDIIFVFRGEQLAPLDYSYVGILEEARQNPIIYPAGDYDNPFVIDFRDSIKPTAWLQNSGADFVYAGDFFIFAEYTRPIHEMAYVWKVTLPFNDPANWRIVQEFEVSGSFTEGFEHGHSVSYDPYSGVILLTVGDNSDSAKIYQSNDFGESWVVVAENQEKYARLLNFVYTEDKIYWGSDSGYEDMHVFLSVDRYPDGTPNFDNITEIYNFGYVPGEKATYTTAYISDPNGILFLDRFDNPTNMPLEIMFWSFETDRMYTVALLNSLEDDYLTYGFRNEAVNWYASAHDNLIVAGFGFYPNDIDILGNSINYRVNNLVLKVTKIIA